MIQNDMILLKTEAKCNDKEKICEFSRLYLVHDTISKYITQIQK